MRHVAAAPKGDRAAFEAHLRVLDRVLHAHRAVPGFRQGRQAEADQIDLVGRLAPHPRAVGVFVWPRLVGDLQVVEAIAGMREAVIPVGVG